jgi:lipopolysaccharide export system protein LptA
LLNWRQNAVLSAFFIICFGVIFLSSNLSIDNDQFRNKGGVAENLGGESYFKRADYYLIGENRTNFHLFSNELIHNQAIKQLILTGPNGVLFSKEGNPIYYSSDSGFYDMNLGLLHLKQQVVVRSKSATISTDDLMYDDRKKKAVAKGGVFTKTQNYDQFYEIRINSDAMSYFPLSERIDYRGSVDGKIERKRLYEPPVFFKADQMSFKMLKRKAEMNGNVSIKKQALTALSRRGEIFLENYNKKLKYFALYDDVIVKELVTPLGKPSFERKSYSEKLEGHTSEGKIVLLGYPKVYQGDDVLKGNVIILRENNETIEVDDANTNFRLR